MDIGGPVYIIPQGITSGDPEPVELFVQWTVYEKNGGSLTFVSTHEEKLSLPDGFAFEAGRSYRLKLKL
jgi:hypothetical protein